MVHKYMNSEILKKERASINRISIAMGKITGRSQKY